MARLSDAQRLATLAQRLATLDDDYQQVDAASGGATLPPGKYSARIIRSEVAESSYNENLTWELEFLTGEGSIRLWHNLEQKDRHTYIKGDLVKLGYEGLLSGLPAAAESFVGLAVAITVKVKRKEGNEYTNVYIDERLADDTLAPALPEKPDPSTIDDDIPFS